MACLISRRKLVAVLSKPVAAVPIRHASTSTLPFLHGKSIVSAKQFDANQVKSIVEASAYMHNAVKRWGVLPLCSDKVIVNAFFEPSTRTQCSFQTAAARLGSQCVTLLAESSSSKKGETLEDATKVLAGYGDAIVLRHPETGAAARAAAVSSKPILNAGDGSGEHPTQALLDTYCIWRELGRLQDLSVTFVGDLKYGRTVHSLSALLALLPGVKINFVSPPQLRMPEVYMSQLKASGAQVRETDALSSVLSESNVLYVTRIQKERFADVADYNKVKGVYVINKQTLSAAKPPGQMCVMHPLPRVDELSTDIDDDPRAAYFRQAEYGLYTRMALLAGVLKKF